MTPFVLGLTGSIGMGKSTVAEMFEALGVPVFDADAEVRRMQGPGGSLVAAIEAEFPGTTGEPGVDREQLGAAVFGDPAALARLEAIVHPAVRAAREQFLERHAEAGLVVLIHNDIDTPFAKQGAEPAYLAQVKTLFQRHPRTTIIWAHIGLGRVVRPVKDQIAIVEAALSDPSLNHVCVDISWDEVAKYIVATPETIAATADAQIPQPSERLTFAQAIERAVARNPNVQIAAAAVLRADALLAQARSATLPQVNGNVTTTTLNTGVKFDDITVTLRDAAGSS